MEVARVSAERGYKVMLYEKSGKMGGHLIAGGVPSFKINDRKLLAWYGAAVGTFGRENQIKHRDG